MLNNGLEFFAAKYPTKDEKKANRGPRVKVSVQQGLLINAFSTSRSTFAEMGISRGNIMHSLDTGSICTSCGELTQGFNVHGQRLSCLHFICSARPGSHPACCQIEWGGVLGMIPPLHPEVQQFLLFWTEFGFIFSLPPFYYCQGHPACFRPVLQGMLFL